MPLAARMQTAARVAVVAGAAYVADLWFNDDLSALTRRFRRKLPVDEQQHRPRVLVLGSGFGALNLVRRLHADQFQVTVVSPRNYFTFTPMLSRAMSGTVDASSITEPFRKYCRRSNVERVKFVEAEALSIHPDEKRVVCRDSSMGPSRLQQLSDVEAAADEALHGDRTLSLDYDYLVVAVGSEPRSFKVPGALEHGFVLRDVVDSQRIRNHVLDCFEAAAMPGQSDEAIDKLLHFVVVGGGFSGCEVCAAVPRRRLHARLSHVILCLLQAAAELHDFVTGDLLNLFPEFKGRVKVSLVEAQGHVLPAMASPLASYAADAFKRQGIQVLAGRTATAVTPEYVSLKHEDGSEAQVGTSTVIWTTGNGVREVVKDLGRRIGGTQLVCDRGVAVDKFLRVKGGDGSVWAIGDCASSGLPPDAAVATQQGAYLAKVFNTCAELMYDRVLPHNQLMQRTLPATASTDAERATEGSESDGGAAADAAGAGAGAGAGASEASVSDDDDMLDGLPAFSYKTRGIMGYVGDKDAVFTTPLDDKSDVMVSGATAWLLYRSVFFSRLLSARNRAYVTADVLKSKLFGRNVSRW